MLPKLSLDWTLDKVRSAFLKYQKCPGRPGKREKIQKRLAIGDYYFFVGQLFVE